MGADGANISDLVFAFTSQFVVAASNAHLIGFVIRSAINHLHALEESNTFSKERKYQDRARDVLERMHPECILEWVKALDLQISEEEYMQYAAQMIVDNDLVGAAILIQKFNFHEQFDMPDLLVRLIEDHNRMDAAKNLVSGHPAQEKLFIEILISLKNIKGAVKNVKEFKLDPAEFPVLVEKASFNAANYFVSQTFRSPSHPDHMPLHKIEDLFSGDDIMIGCLVSLLLKRWERNGKKNPQDALLHKTLGIMQRQNFSASSSSNHALRAQIQETTHIAYDARKDK